MLRRKPTYSINISSSIQREVVPGTVFNVVLCAFNLPGCGVIAGRFYDYFYLFQGRRGLKMKAAVILIYFVSKP